MSKVTFGFLFLTSLLLIPLAAFADVNPWVGTYLPAGKYDNSLIRKLEITASNDNDFKVRAQYIDKRSGKPVFLEGHGKTYANMNGTFTYGRLIVRLSKTDFYHFMEINPRYFPRRRAEGFPSISYTYYLSDDGARVFLSGALERKSAK